MQSCELSFKKVEKNLCYFLIFCTRSTAALTILAEPSLDLVFSKAVYTQLHVQLYVCTRLY